MKRSKVGSLNPVFGEQLQYKTKISTFLIYPVHMLRRVSDLKQIPMSVNPRSSIGVRISARLCKKSSVLPDVRSKAYVLWGVCGVV